MNKGHSTFFVHFFRRDRVKSDPVWNQEIGIGKNHEEKHLAIVSRARDPQWELECQGGSMHVIN